MNILTWLAEKVVKKEVQISWSDTQENYSNVSGICTFFLLLLFYFFLMESVIRTYIKNEVLKVVCVSM